MFGNASRIRPYEFSHNLASALGTMVVIWLPSSFATPRLVASCYMFYERQQPKSFTNLGVPDEMKLSRAWRVISEGDVE